jgi:hypothetical protein
MHAISMILHRYNEAERARICHKYCGKVTKMADMRSYVSQPSKCYVAADILHDIMCGAFCAIITFIKGHCL